MMSGTFFPALDVGIDQAAGGGVVIGGDGKWDARVKAVAVEHGMQMSQFTGEWWSPDGTRFAEISNALKAVAS